MKEAIIKLINKWACSHKWTVHNTYKVVTDGAHKFPHTIRDTFICDHCGKIKRIIL